MARLAAAVFVSSTGDPFSQTVSLVLLYQATHTPLAIAAAFGAQMLGVLAVGGLMGAIADRLDRRQLIVRLEVIRFLIVLTLPLVTSISVFLLYPFLFVLAGIEALVQPSRQAAVPELVSRGEVAAANSLLTTAMVVARAAGFATAGFVLAHVADPRPLYLIDALTFAAAALLVANVGGMGGGIETTQLRGGLRRAWVVPGVRPFLVVAAATALFVGMLNPALLPVAYAFSSNGPTAFTQLEVFLIGGSLMGSIAAARTEGRKRLVAAPMSVWVFAVGVFAVGFSPSLFVAGLAMATSGVGNVMYSVMNTCALMEAARSTNRGVVMSARFTVTQASNVVGLAIGAATTAWLGPLRAFGAFGLGLLLVAAIYTAALVLQARAARDRRFGGHGFA